MYAYETHYRRLCGLQCIHIYALMRMYIVTLSFKVVLAKPRCGSCRVKKTHSTFTPTTSHQILDPTKKKQQQFTPCTIMPQCLNA